MKFNFCKKQRQKKYVSDETFIDGHYTTYSHENFDQPSISKEIANRPRLQKILAMKSCDLLPTIIVMADFYSCILLLISYHMSTKNFLTGGENVTSSAWYSILALSIGYATVRELLQVYVEHVRWFLSPWNYLDVGTIVLVIVSLVQMFIDVKPTNNLVVLTTAFLWLNAIFFLRSTIMSFATFVGGIVKIIFDLTPFIVVSVLILMAFGEMFAMTMLIERGDECSAKDYAHSNLTEFCSFQDSLFITYGLFVEGIELDFYAQENNVVRGISMVFGFLVVIILLNVVIAIVSESWGEAVKQGKEVVSRFHLSNYFLPTYDLSPQKLPTCTNYSFPP